MEQSEPTYLKSRKDPSQKSSTHEPLNGALRSESRERATLPAEQSTNHFFTLWKPLVKTTCLESIKQCRRKLIK